MGRARMFVSYELMRLMEELPEGTKLLGVQDCPSTRRIQMEIEHPDFPDAEISEAGELPLVTARFGRELKHGDFYEPFFIEWEWH